MSTDPLIAQCPARSKRTGERCKRRQKGGGPCRWHGGVAPHVRAAREARIAALEAEAQSPDLSPAEILAEVARWAYARAMTTQLPEAYEAARVAARDAEHARWRATGKPSVPAASPVDDREAVLEFARELIEAAEAGEPVEPDVLRDARRLLELDEVIKARVR